VTGESLSFEAPRPADMNALMAALREDLAVNGPDEH